MVEAEKPSCNGKNRGQCEPGTLAQNDTAADPKTFKPATEWTNSKENFEPVCNGANRGECATGTLAQDDKEVKAILSGNTSAAAKEAAKPPAEKGHPYHAKNWLDGMPATQPICNGKNAGRCEPGTLAQGDSYGADTNIRNEMARSKLNKRAIFSSI